MTWFNENDPFPAAWLRNLYPEAAVDERSILEVAPHEVPSRAHFFAGIGGWEYALALAGWPDDWPVWTGSCPCQPFSVAGRAATVGDERHLWPAFRALIAVQRPPVVFGEQVASRLGREWVAGVRADLEAMGYAVGIADLCAASVGAPHIRQRLYWVADAQYAVWRSECNEHEKAHGRNRLGGGGAACGMADADGWFPCHIDLQRGREQRLVAQDGGAGGLADTVPAGRTQGRPVAGSGSAAGSGGVSGLGNTDAAGRAPRGSEPRRVSTRSQLAESAGGSCGLGDATTAGREGRRDAVPRSGRIRAAWTPSELVPCADGVARRVEPGTFPLAHGIPGRVGRLRAYGNAIVPQVAAAFVRAFMECGRLAPESA